MLSPALWIEEPGVLQSMGLQRVRYNTHTHISHCLISAGFFGVPSFSLSSLILWLLLTLDTNWSLQTLKKNLSFLAVPGFCCCVRAFSSYSEWGLLFIDVRRLLIAVASLVVEHRL